MKTPAVSHLMIKLFYYCLVFVFVVALVYAIRMLFIPLTASVLLAFLLMPVVNAAESKGLSRLSAIVMLYMLILLAFFCVIVFIAPRVMHEFTKIVQNLPRYEQMVKAMVLELDRAIHTRVPFGVPDLYDFLMKTANSQLSGVVKTLPAFASGLFSIISLGVIIPVVTFFILADGHLFKKTVLRVVPNRYFEMFVLLFHKISVAVQAFIRGQLIDALAVGVMTAIGLSIVGLEYSIVIGMVAGAGNLIPYLGPIIGFLPAFAVLLVSSEGITVFGLGSIAIVFAIVQFLEGTFIYPFAVGKSVNLHPLIVIVGVLVGGQIGGVIGMLVAIPLISVFKVTIEVLYSNLKAYSII